MNRLAIALLAATGLTGCLVVHATLPDKLMEDVSVSIDDVSLSALCTHHGQAYSVGATHCMDSQKMRCDEDGRWVDEGAC